jgi:hypothetical protein
MRSVQEALAAMRSCIKSGEPWTETMQRAYDAAMSEAALPAQSGYVEPLVPSVHASQRHAALGSLAAFQARVAQGLSQQQSAARTAHDNAEVLGMAQQPSAPGKMFSREAICAVIAAEKTHPQTEESISTLNRLLSIFKNLEAP